MPSYMPTLVVPDAANVPVNDITAPEWLAAKRVTTGIQSVNLRSEGFSLDGATDETAAFQVLLDNVSPGAQIVLDERANLVLSGQVTQSGKRISIIGHGDATVKTNAKLT